jgi:hypothetical protein
MRVTRNDFVDGRLYGARSGAFSAERYCGCDQHGGPKQNRGSNCNYRSRCCGHGDSGFRLGSGRGDSTVQRLCCGHLKSGSGVDGARKRL